MTGVGQNILNFDDQTCDNDKHKNNKRKFNSIEKEASNIESPYKRPNIKDNSVVKVKRRDIKEVTSNDQRCSRRANGRIVALR